MVLSAEGVSRLGPLHLIWSDLAWRMDGLMDVLSARQINLHDELGSQHAPVNYGVSRNAGTSCGNS